MNGADLWAGFGLATILFTAVAVLVPLIFYYLTLQQTMNAIDEPLRPFAGGLIWLALIPFLGTVWYMVYAILLSSALKKELARRNLAGDGALGVTIATVVLCALCLIPYLNLLAILPFFVLWIIHWVKMAGCKKQLSAPALLVPA